MFCYTGGFSVYALRGGAASVDSVDSSSKAVSLTDNNVALNFGEEPRHSAVAEDAFKFLKQMPEGKYDLIILDPPAFAKHRGAINNALQGYKKLNHSALGKDSPGWFAFYFLLLTSDYKRTVPTGRLQCCCHFRTEGEDPAPTYATGRSSDQYISSRRRIPERTGTAGGINQENMFKTVKTVFISLNYIKCGNFLLKRYVL